VLKAVILQRQLTSRLGSSQLLKNALKLITRVNLRLKCFETSFNSEALTEKYFVLLFRVVEHPLFN
jgi:hypothetical protein